MEGINLVCKNEDIIGKKIVSTNIDEPYPFGYIIFDSGEALVFDEEMDFMNAKSTIRKLQYHEKIREELYKHKVISEELKNTIESQLEARKANAKKNAEKMEYEQYLILKKKYESN